MLKTQENFIKYLDELYLITQDQKTIEYKNNITNQELLIPFVGVFSAGKSSTINSFLGEKLLPTGIDPETTYPAELVYSQDEKMIVFYKNSHTSTHNINEFKTLSRDENISHVRLFINNKNLEKIKPFIIVDMPGFCSTENTHSVNIANYLIKGAYFVVLCPADGTITQDVLQELDNIRKHKKDYIVCLSKIEDISNLDATKAHFKNILETNLLYKKDLLKFAKNSQEDVNALFNILNPEDIFSNIFKKQLLSHNQSLLDNVDLAINAITLDKEECERIIINIQSMKSNLEIEKNRITNYIKTSRIYEIIDQISSKVCKDMMRLVDYFAQKYLNGQNIDSEFMQQASSSFALHSKREINNLREEIISKTKKVLQNISLADCYLDSSKIESISNKIDLDISYYQNQQDNTKQDSSSLALDLLNIATTIFIPTSKLAKAALFIFNKLLTFAIDDSMEKSQRKYEENMRETQLSNIKSQLANNINALENQIKSEYSEDILNYSNNLLNVIMSEFDKALDEFEKTHENELNAKLQKNNGNENRLKELKTLKKQALDLKNKYLI